MPKKVSPYERALDYLMSAPLGDVEILLATGKIILRNRYAAVERMKASQPEVQPAKTAAKKAATPRKPRGPNKPKAEGIPAERREELQKEAEAKQGGEPGKGLAAGSSVAASSGGDGD